MWNQEVGSHMTIASIEKKRERRWEDEVKKSGKKAN
jgi:hypothetical protein